MAITTNSYVLGLSGTDTNNFLLDTDGAGALRIRRKSDGSGGTVLTVNSAGTLVQPAQSMVRVQVANGHGSTNNKIARFSSVVANQGADITYADSATLGASFTINTDGVYAVSFSANLNSAQSMGISRNTTQPTIGIQALTNNSERLAGANSAWPCVAWTGYLMAGDVIRAHTDGSAFAANTLHDFTITRVA